MNSCQLVGSHLSPLSWKPVVYVRWSWILTILAVVGCISTIGFLLRLHRHIMVTVITVTLLRSLCHSHIIIVTSTLSSSHHGHRCHRHHSHTVTVVVSQPCHHRYVTSTLSSSHHGHRCHHHHSHTITVVVSQPLHHRHVNIVIVTSWWWWCRPHPVREHAQDLRPPLGARPASPPTRQAAQLPPRGLSTNPRPLV